jgi:CTP synthase
MVEKGQALWDLWKKTVVPEQYLAPVNIVLVGKYVTLDDAYLSVRKSLEHSAMRCRRKLNLISVDSRHLEHDMQQKDPTKYHNAWKAICEAQGVRTESSMASSLRRRLTPLPVCGSRWLRLFGYSWND